MKLLLNKTVNDIYNALKDDKINTVDAFYGLKNYDVDNDTDGVINLYWYDFQYFVDLKEYQNDVNYNITPKQTDVDISYLIFNDDNEKLFKKHYYDDDLLIDSDGLDGCEVVDKNDLLRLIKENY